MDVSQLQLDVPEYENDRIVFAGAVRTERGPVVKFTLASGSDIWQHTNTPDSERITRELLEQFGFTKNQKPVPGMLGKRVDIPARVSYKKELGSDGRTYVNVNFAQFGGHDDAVMDEILGVGSTEPEEEPVVTKKAASKTPAPSRRRQ